MRGSRARLSGGMLYKQHIGEAALFAAGMSPGFQCSKVLWSLFARLAAAPAEDPCPLSTIDMHMAAADASFSNGSGDRWTLLMSKFVRDITNAHH